MTTRVVAVLLLGFTFACGSPNVGFVVAVVNQSNREVNLAWRPDGPFAGRESEPIGPCQMRARGFAVGVRQAVWIQTDTEELSFIIEPPVLLSGLPPTRTVVIEANGGIQANAPPWPEDQDPC
jgi:hypothetical protein